MSGYAGEKYVGKTAHEVVFDVLLDQRGSADLIGIATALIETLVEWGYPLRYDRYTDTHAPRETNDRLHHH